MVSVLILEDERDLREEIADYLLNIGHEVQAVETNKQFLAYAKTHSPDIAIIDRMLPDGDGLQLIEEVRQQGARLGVIVLTAMGEEHERIKGYAAGVDHYLTKPIRLQELGAVLHALAWRMQIGGCGQFVLQAWDLLVPTGQSLRLTAQEVIFLSTLLKSKGTVVSRRKLVEALGKDVSEYDPRNLDALLLRLRKKVSGATATSLPVKTVHGSGYIALSGLALGQR